MLREASIYFAQDDSVYRFAQDDSVYRFGQDDSGYWFAQDDSAYQTDCLSERPNGPSGSELVAYVPE
jgi:hypothetical protein